MNKNELEKFLLKARTKTYASAKGKSEVALPGSVQYEYAENNFSYRDVTTLATGFSRA